MGKYHLLNKNTEIDLDVLSVLHSQKQLSASSWQMGLASVVLIYPVNVISMNVDVQSYHDNHKNYILPFVNICITVV